MFKKVCTIIAVICLIISIISYAVSDIPIEAIWFVLVSLAFVTLPEYVEDNLL